MRICDNCGNLDCVTEYDRQISEGEALERNWQKLLTTAENGGIINIKDVTAERGNMGDNNNGILIIGPQYFANKNIPKMSNAELERSIGSWKENVEIHKDKISNPDKYYPDWNSYDARYQEGLIRHWHHEIDTFENDITEAYDELKKR